MRSLKFRTVSIVIITLVSTLILCGCEDSKKKPAGKVKIIEEKDPIVKIMEERDSMVIISKDSVVRTIPKE